MDSVRNAELTGTDGSTDLVIVVLNEITCSGWARSCQFSGADYAGTTPVAIAA